MDVMFNWALEFIKGIGSVWEWLTSPLSLGDNKLNDILQLIFEEFNIEAIEPIYLVVGGVLILGLIRRLL